MKEKIANFLAKNVKNVKGGYFGRERFVLTCWAYRILPYLGFDYCRLEEWKFVLKNLPRGKDLKILDVGCVASLFIHELARHGRVVGMDSRPYFENLPKSIQFIQGDALHMPFPDDFFDCITIVSVIEHIGLGSYNDPVADDGDFKAMAELRRVLKKDGRLFVTTIIGSRYSIAMGGNTRIYDEKRFNRLFEKLKVVREEFYIFGKRWIKADRKEVFRAQDEKFELACVELTK